MGNTYYIARHGQTEWNILGKTQGHGNSPLTEKGLAQANELAEGMDKYPLDMIFSSDLGRAMQTAEAVGKRFGIEVQPTEALREMGFGEWEGRLIPEITEKYPEIYKTWRNEPHLAKIPGGETLDVIKERLEKFIDELNGKYDNKNILLVSHSVTVRVLLLLMLDSPMKNIYRIKQDNTALNIVEWRHYGPVVTKMNDTSHIKGDYKLNNSALE